MSLVSVICLVYNHADYLEEALCSVLEQSYEQWELIIVDDASTDDSWERIETLVRQWKDSRITTITHRKRVGNCRSFNEALKLAKGAYVLDLAADDVLMPDRLMIGVRAFGEKQGAAVHFGNMLYIDADGKKTGQLYSDEKSELVNAQGMYNKIVGQYYVGSASVMFNTVILKKEGGYDENLSYEDFDILVRLSRVYPFVYSPLFLVKKRFLAQSMSARQYSRQSVMLPSTLTVCRKIFYLNRNKNEDIALLRRIAYEGKQAFFSANFRVFWRFAALFVRTSFRFRFN